MLYVPLYVEGLRSRPMLVFWLATLPQALLWLLVPLFFYSAPPGELPLVLAVGHEFPLNGNFGPPFAYWIAEVAFRVAGRFGVYLLSQICVVVTYWCVFTLGSAIVGPVHAALTVLLMVGIYVFTVPTPDFGPPIFAMALWAVALLHYWRAVIEKRQRSWYMFGAAAAFILLSSDAALILLGMLALFTALSARGRAALGGIEPWIVSVVLVVVLFVHLLWLEGAADGLTPMLTRLRGAGMGEANTVAWLRVLGALAFAHAGLAILVMLGSGWPRSYSPPAPALKRAPVEASAVAFMKFFALPPALLATIVAVLLGQRLPVGGSAPLVVLSALAIVVAAGDSIELYHQRVIGYAWAGLLIMPAILVPAMIIVLPWAAGTDLKVTQPAAAMARFFAESFERRTGRPLAIVSGDARTAALIALAAPSRPSVYFDSDPGRSPWITSADIQDKGAVVVWPATNTDPTPPPEIAAHFPDLAPEVPQTFARSLQGRAPPLRIGWGMIRPANAAAPAAAPAPATSAPAPAPATTAPAPAPATTARLRRLRLQPQLRRLRLQPRLRRLRLQPQLHRRKRRSGVSAFAPRGRVGRSRKVRQRSGSVIRRALGDLAAEQPGGEGGVGENDRQHHQCADEHEGLARRRRRGFADRQVRWHDVGKGRDHQPEIAETYCASAFFSARKSRHANRFCSGLRNRKAG